MQVRGGGDKSAKQKLCKFICLASQQIVFRPTPDLKEGIMTTLQLSAFVCVCVLYVVCVCLGGGGVLTVFVQPPRKEKPPPPPPSPPCVNTCINICARNRKEKNPNHWQSYRFPGYGCQKADSLNWRFHSIQKSIYHVITGPPR